MPQRRLKLTLEFDGTHFYGWQIQSKTGERTVQKVIQEALAKLPGEHSSLKAAGRTDAGVHALGMVAHFDTTSHIPHEKLLRAINAHLPADVRILKLEPVSSSFEAQYDCLYRRYHYHMRIYRHDLRSSSLDRFRVLAVLQDLDVAAMQRASQFFLGTHDFSAFATQEIRSSIKTIFHCGIIANERDIMLDIAGDGFLRNMVRAIVGTLIDVGSGSLKAEVIPEIIASKNRSRAGKNVAPHGLYFVEAGYESWRTSPK